jgi:predicted ester cyclase
MTNTDVLTGFYAALDQNDTETAVRLLGPNHQVFMPMAPGPMNAEQHVGMSKAFHESFSQSQHELLDIMESGNKIAARGLWHGVHTGDFNGIPPTGKEIRLSFITIAEIENNEVRNQWTEMDSMYLMAQIQG